MNYKLYRALAVLLALVAVVLSSGLALAQEEVKGLSLRMSPGSYRSEIVRGEDNIYYIEVVNNTSQPINGINLYFDGPEKGWAVNFEPQYITSLAANSYTTVDVIIRAPDNIEKGSYDVTCIAESGDKRAVLSIYLWVEQSNPLWLWIGGATAVVVVAGFVYVFLRMGRQ